MFKFSKAARGAVASRAPGGAATIAGPMMPPRVTPPRAHALLAALAPAVLVLPAAVRPAPPAGSLHAGRQDGEAEAQALLEKAEELVRDGRHAAAVRTYEKIAADYEGTSAAAVAARRAQPSAYLGSADVVRTGPSANRVDIVILGDGYELDKLDTYVKLVEDVPRVFERNDVFAEYLSYLNVLRGDVVSEESGLDAYGREKRTALGAAMSEGDFGQVTVDREAVRDLLRFEMPDADGMAVVLVPLGTLGTGGGGVAAVAAREFLTLLHEWGHAFAGLGDEYTTDSGFRGDPSLSPNISYTPDEAGVPWAHFLAAKVRGVGVYEGADGRVRGAWKPTTAGCVMGTGESFCPVCREAIVLRIHEFVDPIDVALPEPTADGAPIRLRRDGPELEVEVQVMRPASHRLEVAWWLFDARSAPPASRHSPTWAATGERSSRGRLAPIERRPDKSQDNARDGRYGFTVDPDDLEPGEYRLIVRAIDTTEVRGDKWPWVLRDERDLLKSERVWSLVVE